MAGSRAAAVFIMAGAFTVHSWALATITITPTGMAAEIATGIAATQAMDPLIAGHTPIISATRADPLLIESKAGVSRFCFAVRPAGKNRTFTGRTPGTN